MSFDSYIYRPSRRPSIFLILVNFMHVVPWQKANFLFVFLFLVIVIEIHHNRSHWSYVTNYQFQVPFGFGTSSTGCGGNLGTTRQMCCALV